jgi:hypothetical protein
VSDDRDKDISMLAYAAVHGNDDQRNRMLVNEFSFLRDESIPTVAGIQAKYEQKAAGLNQRVRIKLRLKFK